MNTRIKLVREQLRDADGRKYTQSKIAEEMHVTRDMVAAYEGGRVEPSLLFISTFCEKFNVSEEWLRNGTGEMFKPQDRNSEIADIVAEMYKNDESDFRFQLTKLLYELSADEISLLKNIALKLVAETKEDPAD